MQCPKRNSMHYRDPPIRLKIFYYSCNLIDNFKIREVHLFCLSPSAKTLVNDVYLFFDGNSYSGMGTDDQHGASQTMWQ